MSQVSGECRVFKRGASVPELYLRFQMELRVARRVELMFGVCRGKNEASGSGERIKKRRAHCVE